MHLTRLALTDFRSYEAAELRLEPGVTTLLGSNGQGKTNLVEAAAYVATLGSHRVATDAPLVRSGAARAIVRAEVAAADRDSLVEIEINPGRANRARLNRSPVARPRQVLGVLRTVLFAPEDLALVKGDPEQRRRYLDDLLVASAPRYAGVRADYERVLRQRTALLKSLRGRPGGRGHGRTGDAGGGRGEGSPAGRDAAEGEDGDIHSSEARLGTTDAALGTERGPSARRGGGLSGPAARTLDVWDEHLAQTGAELLTARIRLTARLRPLVDRAYAAVSGAAVGAQIGYRQSSRAEAPDGGGRALAEGADPALTEGGPPQPPPDAQRLADSLREALARLRADELERGVCLVGPHRDDLDLRVGGLPARGYASHGESWSLALALRLAAYDLLRSLGDDPVLLLDDVFAELDAGRRDRLAALVADAEQVLVTAAVAADVPAALAGARFDVKDGTVTRAG